MGFLLYLAFVPRVSCVMQKPEFLLAIFLKVSTL